MRGREKFLEQSVKYFLRQDYPNKDMYIIGDSDEVVENTTAYPIDTGYNNIYRLDIALGTNVPTFTPGRKRNIACFSAYHSDLLALWDDDEYFAPHRLYVQAEPIINGLADISACHMELLYDTRHNGLYRCSDEAHNALFRYGVRSNTLMFKSSYWHTDNLRYEDSRSGEDTRYMLALLDYGARLFQVRDTTAFISIRHNTNVSDALQYGEGWQRVDVGDYIPQEDRAFYEQFREVKV